MLDVDKMAEAIFIGTQALIAKSLEPIIAENTALRARLDAVELMDHLDPEPLPDIAKMISTAIDAIPKPDIITPTPAKDGVDGKDAVLPDIAAMVSDAVSAIPPPFIPEPIPGKDGLSIAEVKQNADGELIVKMTNGETINAGLVRGAPGIGFDDMTVDHDGERALTFRFQRGDIVKEFAFQIPAIIDRGVWVAGEFAKGDAVSWGGSMWVAQLSTEDKPGQSKAWRLAVKKGHDAKTSVRVD